MINDKNKLRKIPGKPDLFFFVDSDNLDEDIKFIRKEKIENIALNPFHGYKIDNINWLKEVPFIKRAELGGCYAINYDGLKYLTELEHLTFFPMKGQAVDFHNINKLTHLCFQFNKNMRGLDDLNLLESLVISKGELCFFSGGFFENYSRLKVLSISDSRLPESLSFLKKLNYLTHLELNYIKSKINLSELKELSESLEVLKIDHAKNIYHFEAIETLKKMKTLSIVDSIQLRDTSFVDFMPHLEILIVLGSSYFVDGDLSNLKKLKHVSIDDKKHYSLKYKDLKGDFSPPG